MLVLPLKVPSYHVSMLDITFLQITSGDGGYLGATINSDISQYS